MVTQDQIVSRIQENIADATVQARDLTGGGDHWQVVVRSPAFAEKSLVQQHQMVYQALGEWMHKEIHALALDTATP